MKNAVQSKKKRIIFLAILGVFAVISIASAIVFSNLGDTLLSQKAAERFRGENEQLFAQVSAFFPIGKGISEEDIYRFRMTVDQKLVDASLESTGNGSLYRDGYSAKGQVTVTGGRGTATVSAIGVGGDYFMFHPLVLESGNYIYGDDLMHDMIVVDKDTAWRLFGGEDLAGMEVTIGGEPYLIAGVVSREDDFASKRAYTDGAGIYMAYDKLNAISETTIDCYEIACVDPIEGFAADIVKGGFSDAVVVENSSRYTFDGIWNVISSFGERSMNTAGVVFPYWENAARLVEDYAAVALFVSLLFGIAPAAAIIVAAVIYARRGVNSIKEKIPKWIEDRNERKYAETQLKKAERSGDDG